MATKGKSIPQLRTIADLSRSNVGGYFGFGFCITLLELLGVHSVDKNPSIILFLLG